MDKEYFDNLDKAAEAKVEKPLDLDKLALSLAPTLEQIKQSLEKGDIEGARALAGCGSISLSEDVTKDDEIKESDSEDETKEDEIKESEHKIEEEEKEAEEIKQSVYDAADSIEKEIRLSNRSDEAKKEILKQVLQLKEKLI